MQVACVKKNPGQLNHGTTGNASAGLPALIPRIQGGKLRAIAVGTAQRLAQLPDVPTVAEMGHKDFETSKRR